MDRLKAAMITDLVALDDDPAVLRALVGKAVRTAAALEARILLMATTSSAHARALAGFLSPATPLVGRLLARRAPQFMWRPKGARRQVAGRSHDPDLRRRRTRPRPVGNRRCCDVIAVAGSAPAT